MADLTTALATLVTKMIEALPAATGAMISLRFIPRETLSKGQRITTAIAAYAIGTYVGRGICAHLDVTNERMIDAIVFGVALFGLSFVGTAISEMKPIIQALRRKWFGEVPSDKEGA